MKYRLSYLSVILNTTTKEKIPTTVRCELRECLFIKKELDFIYCVLLT